ncbi:MAG: hypothetical protein Kow0029_09420 [Candidatus Rifleibacteriota bacterium]
MNKTSAYLKMKTPADMLAVNFFSSAGQLKGRFMQEVDPPWTIWWQTFEEKSIMERIGTMLKGGLPQPESVWEKGVPNGKLKEISWLDLFRKAVIKKQESRKVSEEVVLITPDKEIFYNTVKQHFALQQGQIEFAVFSSGKEYYMLRIQKPSLWVLNTISSANWTWFNLVPGQSGIYVEAGYYIHDISGESCFNRFQITESGILLIQKDGRLLTLKPKWKKGESIIRVQFSGPQIQQKEEIEILEITPVLRESERKDLPTLWKIEEIDRFKAILVNESLDKFRSYRAWFCKGGFIYIFAKGKQADRGLASVLSDAFKAFCQIGERVFVPQGRMLFPRLSSERLHEIIGAKRLDYIIIEQHSNGLLPIILADEEMSPIEDFITLQAQKAVETAETLKPGWKFEFKNLKKKKQVVEIEVKSSVFEKLEAVSEDGQVGAGGFITGKKREKRRTINLADVPQPTESESSSLRLQLEQIDSQLLQNVAIAQLWEQRAEICRRMRLRVSAVASLMNAAIIKKDNEALAECIFEYCEIRPEFKAMSLETISEIEKGKLLAEIRKETINSEFAYVLLLAYAAKFDDFDIYQQAVSLMKTSFPGEKREFYGFNEIRGAAGGGMNVENRVELLTEDDFPRIKANVRKFLLQVGCGRSISCIDTAKLQLHRILAFHLSQDAADRLVSGVGVRYDSVKGASVDQSNLIGNSISSFRYMIKMWPAGLEVEGLSPAVARWQKLLVMDKIKETPLRDFFTGDLYKPPYLFYRTEEQNQNGLLSVKWIRELSEEHFPAVSDGKPIARAIYYRFADQNDDWDDYFKMAMKSKDVMSVSKTQRLILLMVSEFGPHQAFARYIMPAVMINEHQSTWDIYSLTMYCDMYRLCLAYKKPIDEQRLFMKLVSCLPQPPHGWNAFSSSAEWVILCLLLSSSPARRFQLDNLIVRVMSWLYHAENTHNMQMYAESLTVFSFLCIGVLADLVPQKLELHQLLEKRKVLWFEHAFGLSARGEAAFREWQRACGF